MIPFNEPCYTGNEEKYLSEVIKNKRYAGDGEFTYRCNQWFESALGCQKALLTTSCTHALEMAAILSDIKPGDEVIMPSFTFPSTANAFVLRGAKIVFVDIRPDTMNIDENLIEPAITEKTRAIVPVHYAGVACEMDVIMGLAQKYNLIVIEDAAQAILSTYKGRYLGTIGHFGCLSFHESKNIQCGEGGVLLINNEKYIERAEIIREKGTNRTKFWRGEIDKYGWIDVGSSYLLSEINAAFLFAQLEAADQVVNNRIHNWDIYNNCFNNLEKKGVLDRPIVPDKCQHNGHIFFIKVKNIDERSRLIGFLRQKEIYAVFHYIPLHMSVAGKRFGQFSGNDLCTTKESERLVRLPMFYNMGPDSIFDVYNCVSDFLYNHEKSMILNK